MWNTGHLLSMVLFIKQYFPDDAAAKNLPANAGDARDAGSILGLGRFPWRRAWQPTPSILAWRNVWIEESGGLQSMGSQRVGHY